MRKLYRSCRCVVVLGLWLFGGTTLNAQQAGLHGIVTDPSGARIAGAKVTVQTPAGEQKQSTNSSGEYAFPSLASGTYRVEFAAPEFKTIDKSVTVSGATTLNIQLELDVAKQTVNVQETAATGVSVDPESNASAIVLGQKELEAFS